MRLALCLALAVSIPGLNDAARAATKAPPLLVTNFAPLPVPQGGSGPIPEPSTLLLVGSGLVGVALTARLRRRRK